MYDIVKEFVTTFENDNLLSEDAYTIIENISSERSVHSAKKGDDSYLLMVKLLLERREIVYALSKADLHENNKKIEYDFGEIERSQYNINIKVDVIKVWNYDGVSAASGARDSYLFDFVYEDNRWKIDKVSGLNKIICDNRIINLSDEISSEDMNLYLDDFYYEDLDEQNESHSDVSDDMSGYDRAYSLSQTALYAYHYALSRNSSYADFTNNGGDCTNFISQAIKYGGLNMHYGTPLTNTCWYYTTSTDRSSSWTSANLFRQYIFGNNSHINATNATWSNIKVGELIQKMSNGSATHSMIVTGQVVSGNTRTDLLVSAHTTDRRNASLAMYYSGTKKYTHIKGNK